MDIKDFLLKTEALNLTGVANLMWPTNKSAKTYLSKKLNKLNGRSFTKKDAELALKVLNELADSIKKLEAISSFEDGCELLGREKTLNK